MSIALQQPSVAELTEVVDILSTWQRDGTPVQLHPGDLGWHWRHGADVVADAVCVWRRDGRILAVGFSDGATLVRLGIAPENDADEELAARILADVSDPSRGLLPDGEGAVEARAGTALRRLLAEQGWEADEPWVPLSRDLTEPVEPIALRVERVTESNAAHWLTVVQIAFGSAAPPPERWPNLAGSPMVQDQLGRCLLGYDDKDRAVAAVAVWSAGRGRPGLLEPLGVHDEQRGRGHGRAMTLAAAAELRSMGSSSVVVATPQERGPAVATYLAAGFTTEGPVTDFCRPD